MRTKLAMFLVLAGGVAGCASNPPPPPPMAMAPEPAPMAAPMPRAPAARSMTFRGMVEAGADNAATCRKMGGTVSTRVNRGSFALGGMRGKVGNDGAVMSAGRAGGITGTLANGTMDVTETKGACTYHYVLNQA